MVDEEKPTTEPEGDTPSEDAAADETPNTPESEDATGGAGSEERSDTAETPEGGSEAAGEAGGQEPAQPQAPTGEALLELLGSDPAAQAALRQRMTTALQEAQTQQQQRARTAEFDKMVEEGRFEEIGRQFVDEQREAATRSQAEEVALREVYGDIYRRLFQHPVMGKLSAEDRVTLDPQNYETDADYVMALTAFIALHSQDQKLEEMAQERANATLQALANQNAAATATGDSVSGLPPATELGSEPRSSSDLIAAGWDELLNPTEE